MKRYAFLLLAVAAALSPRNLEAQQPSDGLSPREVSDPEYAVRVQVDRLAEMIRHGRVDGRRVEAPEVAAAALSAAAAASRRARPHPDLGPLWDYQLEIRGIVPAGANRLVVRTWAYLATQKVMAPVTLVFAAEPTGSWRLVDHHGLVAQLEAMERRLRGGAR